MTVTTLEWARPLVPLLVTSLTVLVATPTLVLADLRERRLPNAAVAVAASGLPVGWIVAVVEGSRGDAVRSMTTFGIAGVMLVGLAVLGAFGMGDAKLGAVLVGGLALDGLSVTSIGAVVATGAGGLAAAGSLMVERWRRTDSTSPRRAESIAFGPCLLAGYWVAVGLEISRGASC